MIHVKRGPAPGALTGPEVEKATAVLREHYELPPEKRPQVKPQRFPDEALRQTRTALAELFRGKCAFCETRLSTAVGDIERFRPRGGVSESSGGYLSDYYWAQTYAWENLYLSCPNCNRSKANRFPLESGSQRAPADADRARLSAERPLLLVERSEVVTATDTHLPR